MAGTALATGLGITVIRGPWLPSAALASSSGAHAAAVHLLPRQPERQGRRRRPRTAEGQPQIRRDARLLHPGSWCLDRGRSMSGLGLSVSAKEFTQTVDGSLADPCRN
jgi:hypothetical protein